MEATMSVLNFILNTIANRKAGTETSQEINAVASHLLGVEHLGAFKEQFAAIYHVTNPDDHWPAMLMLRSIVETGVRTLSKELRNRRKQEEQLVRMGGIEVFERHRAMMEESRARAGVTMPPSDVDPLIKVLGDIDDPEERLATLRQCVEDLYIELQGVFLTYESAQSTQWAGYELQGLGFYSYRVDDLTNEYQTIWDLDLALARLDEEAEEFKVRQSQSRTMRLARLNR